MLKHVDFIVFSDDNLPIEVGIWTWARKIITKTGAKGGIVVEVEITYQDRKYHGYTVCHPLDEFNFSFGAKSAFERALAGTKNYKYDERLVMCNLLSDFDYKKLWREFLSFFPPKVEEVEGEWEDDIPF